MRKFVFLTLLILNFSLTMLAKEPDQITVRLGQQRSVDHGRIKIRFISVVEDSRCPMNARCVWAGNAKIKIAVTNSRGVVKIVNLNTNLEPKVVSVYGYRLSLEDLNPQKGAPADMRHKPKTATITVERARV